MKFKWLLLKLGGDMGLDVWVAKNDKNKVIMASRLFHQLKVYWKNCRCNLMRQLRGRSS